MGKQYSYVISPVAYKNGKEIDRTFDTVRFSSREDADNFINDMGSRWVMYPNIEILKVPGDGEHFNRKDARLIVGYSEAGEYGPVTKTSSKKPKSSKPARKHSSRSRSVSGMQGMR